LQISPDGHVCFRNRDPINQGDSHDNFGGDRLRERNKGGGSAIDPPQNAKGIPHRPDRCGVVVREANGKVRLRQLYNLTAAGAVSGGFRGALVGLLFLNPLFGFAIGAAAGAISGTLRDVGIDDNFMKDLAQTLKPGTAALCVLVHHMTPDRVVEDIQKFGGTVIRTNLCHEEEAKLRAALASVQKSPGTPAVSAS